jgi:hypothetical protein
LAKFSEFSEAQKQQQQCHLAREERSLQAIAHTGHAVCMELYRARQAHKKASPLEATRSSAGSVPLQQASKQSKKD